MRSGAQWLTTLGVAGLGILGIKAMKDYAMNPANALPKGAAEVATKTKEGAENGLKNGLEILGPAARELITHEHTQKVLSERSKYTETEFAGALLSAFIQDGYDFVIDEAGIAVVAGGKLLQLTGTFYGQAYDYFYNQNMTPKTTGDLMATYVNGVLVFASSLAALKLVTLNRVGKNANMLLETGLWPIYTVKRGAQGSYSLLRGTTELADSQSATRLTMSRMNATVTREVRLTAGRRLSAATPDGLHFRYEFAQDQRRLFESAEINERIRKNADSLELFKVNMEKSIDEFGQYLKGMKEADIPPQFMDAFREVTSNANVQKLTREQLSEILKKMGGKEVQILPNEVPATATKTVPSTTKAPKPKVPGSSEPLPSSATTAAAHADDIKFADNISDALKEASIDDFFKGLDLSDAVKAEILADETASNIIKGAAKSGDVAEKARVARMLEKGSKLRAAAIGGGMALSTLSLYMAYAELMENKEKIAKTNNPELQKIYAQTNLLVSADAGVQTVGIVIDGIALYQTASGTIICSAAAPVGYALLPVTAGVMAVREGYRQSAQLQEYFATTDRDLAKMPPNDILKHIADSTPMEYMNGMQSFISKLSMEDAVTQQDANLNSRANGYRAYFAQSAEKLIPHPTISDVRALRNAEGEDVTDADVITLHKDWLSQYVLEAESRVRQLTQGQFYLVDTDVLNQVRTEAFAKWMTRRWGQKTEKNNYKGQDIETIWRQDIVAQAGDPDSFVPALPAYILQKTEVADALAFAERDLSALNFLSASEKQMARATLLYGMRKEMQDFMSRVDEKKETSDRAIQYLVQTLKDYTKSPAWTNKEHLKSVPMTAMMKELANTPILLSGATLEQFLAKYPLRPIYTKSKNGAPPPDPSYPEQKFTNAA